MITKNTVVWCDVIRFEEEETFSSVALERQPFGAAWLARTSSCEDLCVCAHFLVCVRWGEVSTPELPTTCPTAWVVLLRQSTLRPLACRVTGEGNTEVRWFLLWVTEREERVGHRPHPERVFLAETPLLSMQQQLRLWACGWCVGDFDSHPKN